MTHKIHRECQSAIDRCADINKRMSASIIELNKRISVVMFWAFVTTVFGVLTLAFIANGHIARMDKINQENISWLK